MTDFKFSLDKGSNKFPCPGCGHKRFVRYVDVDTKEYIHESVGRCDRENNCGHHHTPKQFFTENPSCYSVTKKRSVTPVTECYSNIDYLPFGIFDKSVSNHERCNFFPFLEKLFRIDIANELCENYFIGANKYGDTVFWQVDIVGNIRQAKVMKYDPETGRRNKDTGAIFAGKKILNNQEANLQQCFFGEYLLSFPENNDKPVAIVESEKTAVIASIYYPDFVWMATGGKHGAKWTERNVCKVLQGWEVVLFPDVNTFDKWKQKGSLLQAITGSRVVISDYLEKNASDEDKGLDIADYILSKSSKVNLGQFGSILTSEGQGQLCIYEIDP